MAATAALDPECVMHMAATAEGATTLGQVRQRCAATPQDPVTAASEKSGKVNQQHVRKRLETDRESAARPFTIMAHKPNYFLLGAWNEKGWDPDPYREQSGDPDYQNDNVESQFQISLKAPLAIGLFGDRMDIYGAYTNRSFWQVFNEEYSRPFRETNHEPELWAQFRNDWTIGGFTNSVNTIGLVHQSNGRGGELSRSWNRMYASFIFEKGPWVIAVKPWVWLRGDRDDSDNPDITDYMGHGELRLAYGRNHHVFSLMTRNQVESGFDQGAFELSWSFPLFGYPYLKGYVQYFNGYGESLIDYDNKVNRIGVGISLTDWLD
jgi:phospholipase A1